MRVFHFRPLRIKKKYFLASENCEAGYVTWPASRGKATVAPRKGEFGNSHYTTLTGLELPSRAALPRISVEDKLAIFTTPTSELPTKWTTLVPSGVPMYWQELKSVQTWKQLFSEVVGKIIVDTTPSQAAAVAAMDLGIQYVALAHNATYLTWLTNAVDRAALKYVCQSGHYLYQEELATHIKEHFADLVEDVDEENAIVIEEEDIDVPDPEV